MAISPALILLTSTAVVLTTPQRDVAARAEQRLLAPCCYSQAVGEHMSAEADQMRQEIEQMAASGQSETAIIEHYKIQYGERILVVPDGRTGRALFVLPLVALILLSTIFIWALRRMVRAGTLPCPLPKQEELERLRRDFGKVIERQLREMG